MKYIVPIINGYKDEVISDIVNIFFRKSSVENTIELICSVEGDMFETFDDKMSRILNTVSI